MALIASAAGGLLLLDTVRIWLPSLTTIFGSAGTTDPLTLAAFALVWVLPAAFAIPLTRRWPTATPAVLAGTATAARLVGQAGVWQLYTSCVATTALFGWLVAVATKGWPTKKVAVGLAVSLATATLLQLLSGSVDLTWWSGPVPWLLIIGCGAVMVAAARERYFEESATALWFAVGPTLLLAGIITTTTSRVEHGFIVGVGATVGIALTTRSGPAWLVAALIIGATALADLPRDNGNFPWWTAIPQATLAALLPAALGHAANSGTQRHRGASAYGGLLVFFFLCSTYFVAFDTSLPVWRPGLVLLAAVLVGAAAVTNRTKLTQPVPWLPLVPAAVAMVLATTVNPAETPANHQAAWPVKVVTYNVRYGISEDGRFAPGMLVSAITALEPDVVMLQEVDRGMLVNGQHDVLAQLQKRLGMHAYYAPSSDPLFGDAILSRQPLDEVSFHSFPRYDIATGAGVLCAVLRMPGGDLGLAVSHLHENDNGISARQVGDLTAEIREMRAKGSLLLAGDFNAEPDNPKLGPIKQELKDGLAAKRPLNTWPAGSPTQQLDHVFVSEDLDVGDVVTERTNASDHLPVAVTVTRRNG
ncbi:hypothetical protein Lesp02_36100 [Lentzea sp. NBRC 105346]|uniref:endonuclease/exonuclease/phosphatase family protein n=1 Tax=Lentzea sp. NBRC 105346 TaxID=3032205 RepID=UPI0024A2FBC2|nr:endonuclease/exonuclease/phosphatase family protein [Lentzea sp. NBRC 105346]GLZ31422.1 hypothetical protein Lesp02_36100 [Lentzea sp. NBRC 105346]